MDNEEEEEKGAREIRGRQGEMERKEVGGEQSRAEGGRGGGTPNMWRQLFQAEQQSMTQQKPPNYVLDLMRSEGSTLGAY